MTVKFVALPIVTIGCVDYVARVIIANLRIETEGEIGSGLIVAGKVTERDWTDESWEKKTARNAKLFCVKHAFIRYFHVDGLCFETCF